MSIARPDRAFFFIAAACVLAYVSLPRDSAYYDRWYQLFPVAAVAATLVGVWLNRPRSKAPWFLVAISGLCAVTADALYAIELEQIGTVPFPSTADYFALGSYAVLAAALLLMIRMQAPGRDWPSLIDAGIVTVGVAIVGWTFLVHPGLTNDTSTLETTVALAFPVMDVLLVSLAARMVLGPGSARRRSRWSRSRSSSSSSATRCTGSARSTAGIASATRSTSSSSWPRFSGGPRPCTRRWSS